MARVIIDLRNVDLSRPNAPATMARNLADALLRAGLHDYQVLEPGFRGRPPASAVNLDLGGGSPRFGPRNLVLVPELDHLLGDSRPGPLRLVAGSWRVALTTGRADLLLAPSNAIRGGLIDYLRVPAGRIAICPPGLEPGFVRPPPADGRTGLERLGLEGRYLLVFGGRRAAVEEAWQAVEGRSGVRLVMADSLPVLNRTDLRVALSGALACLYCAPGCGVPLGPLEAMACGTPPIVLADAAYPEVVRDGGLLIRQDAAVADWRESMAAVIRSPKLRGQLSRRARDLAGLFTADRTARLLAPLLDPRSGVDEGVDPGQEDGGSG